MKGPGLDHGLPCHVCCGEHIGECTELCVQVGARRVGMAWKRAWGQSVWGLCVNAQDVDVRSVVFDGNATQDTKNTL